MKPKDWFRQFFFLFYFIIFYFFLRTQVARNKTSGYTVTKYPPVTPLLANSTTVRRPLDKMKPKDWFRHFFLFVLFIIFFFLRTQIARNKTSGYMVTKYPPVTPLRANSTTVRRPLDKMKPKDWLRQFFPVLFYVRTQVATLNKTSGYHGYKETLQWSHFEPTVQRLGRPLDKLRSKDWFRHLSTSTCEERVKRL